MGWWMVETPFSTGATIRSITHPFLHAALVLSSLQSTQQWRRPHRCAHRAVQQLATGKHYGRRLLGSLEYPRFLGFIMFLSLWLDDHYWIISDLFWGIIMDYYGLLEIPIIGMCVDKPSFSVWFGMTIWHYLGSFSRVIFVETYYFSIHWVLLFIILNEPRQHSKIQLFTVVQIGLNHSLFVNGHKCFLLTRWQTQSIIPVNDFWILLVYNPHIYHNK